MSLNWNIAFSQKAVVIKQQQQWTFLKIKKENTDVYFYSSDECGIRDPTI